MSVVEIGYRKNFVSLAIPQRIGLLQNEISQCSSDIAKSFFIHFFAYFQTYLSSWKQQRGDYENWQHESLRFGIEKAALEELSPHPKLEDLTQIVNMLNQFFPQELWEWYKYAIQPINRVDKRHRRLLVATRAYFEKSLRLGAANVSLVK